MVIHVQITAVPFFVTRVSRRSIRGSMSPLEDNTLMERLMTTVDPHHDDHHGHLEDTNMSSVLIAKGVTMIILCVVSTCMGILPLQMAKCLKWNTTDVANPRYSLLGLCNVIPVSYFSAALIIFRSFTCR